MWVIDKLPDSSALHVSVEFIDLSCKESPYLTIISPLWVQSAD